MPAPAGLGPEEVGITLGEQGEVKVDHQLRSTEGRGIYSTSEVCSY